jgi:DNA polymerase III subunit beta
MKFKLLREDLLRPLKAALATVETSGKTLPVLSHVLLDYQRPPVLTVTATDTGAEYHAVTATANSGEPGQVCAPARKLFDIVRLLPAQSEIMIATRDTRLRLECGRSRYSMATLPADNFPAFDMDNATHEITVDAALLRQALDAVAPASGVNDVRTYLNGTLLRASGHSLSIVASDGHRVGSYCIPELETAYGGILDAILPRQAALDMARALRDVSGEVRLTMAPRSVSISLDTDTYSARLIEGRYADYERSFPAQFVTTVRVGRAALVVALQRAGTLSGDHRGVQVTIPCDGSDVFTLAARNRDDEHADDEIEGVVTGDPRVFGLNLEYLLGFLGHIRQDTVDLSFSDEGMCMVSGLDDTNYQCMVAPMRL